LKRSVGVLGIVLGLAVCLPLTQASGRPAEGLAVTPVTEIALRASEVGPGYRARVIPGGRQVKGRVTLDLCGFRYPSDALRTSRIQMLYLHPREKLALSNEVVRYRGTGSQQALRELEWAAAHCPPGNKVTRIRDPRLLPASVAVANQFSTMQNGKRVVTGVVMIYQVHGNALSAVYVYRGTAATRKRFGLRAAAISANKLRQS
jgi:hypothetical protein